MSTCKPAIGEYYRSIGEFQGSIGEFWTSIGEFKRSISELKQNGQGTKKERHHKKCRPLNQLMQLYKLPPDLLHGEWWPVQQPNVLAAPGMASS